MAESKYHPLHQFLRSSNQPEVTLTFAEMETLMGEPLPDSARSKKIWWSNRKTGLQAKAWMEADYLVAAIDLTTEQVTFRKPKQIYKVERSGNTVLWNAELIKALRRHTGWSQQELADKLETYQPIVSDWEVGAHKPQKAMSKLLTMLAKEVGFQYGDSD